MLARAKEPASTGDNVTAREREIARMVAEGLTDREIAAHLRVSRRTVDRHLRNVFDKVGVANRAALAAYAVRHGWL
jgi:DNA-binding NarL/FixJ family response regulator